MQVVLVLDDALRAALARCRQGDETPEQTAQRLLAALDDLSDDALLHMADIRTRTEPTATEQTYTS